jgi:cephalosporin hydroxylase
MLRKIFDKYGCDKGSARHRYDRVYEPAFRDVRERPITLIEIGIFTGASLAAWLEYFPAATIVGVDTFQRVRPAQIHVLRHPRVRWFRCDSTLPLPADLAAIEADVIIDDGNHTPDAQLATLRHFRPLLKAGGRYFIEDAPELKIPGATVHDLRKGGEFDSRILQL